MSFVTSRDMQPDAFGMNALEDLRKRAEAVGLANKPQTVGPWPKAGVATMRYCPIRNCFVKNDGSDDIRVAAPPEDNEQQLAAIRERHAVIVEQRNAQTEAEEAERNRIANLERRIAELEAEKAARA